MEIRLFSVYLHLSLNLDFFKLYSSPLINRNIENQYISSMVKQHTFPKRSTIQWHFTSILYLNDCENKREALI